MATPITLNLRIQDRRLLCACIGVIALFFQWFTPIAVQNYISASDALASDWRIICTAYGLKTLAENEDETETTTQNFCPYCQVQELAHSLLPTSPPSHTSVLVVTKTRYLSRSEPAHIRHARLPAPRSPPFSA